MRKNGVNREIRAVSGGLSAIDGVRISEVFLDEKNVQLALFSVDGLSPVAVCAPSHSLFEEESRLAETARAVCFIIGATSVAVSSSEQLTRSLKTTLAEKLSCKFSDILLFSIGEINGEFPAGKIQEKLPKLVEDLKSLKEIKERSFAYAFDLGDFPCLLSGVALFKSQNFNGSPLSLWLATDVCISPKLLKTALVSAYKDTFGMLGRKESAFDFLGIVSTQKAGNAILDREDGEYKKFVSALKKVFEELAKSFAVGAGERVAEIFVQGGRSKQAARTAVKCLTLAFAERKENGTGLLTEIFSAIGKDLSVGNLLRASVYIQSKTGTLVLCEEGISLPVNAVRMQEILTGENLRLSLNFHEGNFSASSWVRI